MKASQHLMWINALDAGIIYWADIAQSAKESVRKGMKASQHLIMKRRKYSVIYLAGTNKGGRSE